MNTYLQHRINKGALFVESKETASYLVHATYQASTQLFSVSYILPEARLLRHRKWEIQHWDIDQVTDKLYAAYSPEDYVQVKPLHFEELKKYRISLEMLYLQLTNELLPQAAIEQQWVIRENHCFQRVILDHIFQRAWYEVLPKSSKAAYKRLDNYSLGKAIFTAYQVYRKQGVPIEQLQSQSLHYRNKHRTDARDVYNNYINQK
ncbi:MAG: hypothetical protein AAF798_06560 [Bacteroidota bacterium]